MCRIVRTSCLLLAAAALAGCERPQAKMAAPPPPVVLVSRPTSDYVTDYEEFTGRTDAEFTITVRARVTGYLEKVFFKDGDEVNKGDLMFEIDSRPYKADLARMESNLAQAEAHLTRLEADFRRAKQLWARGSIGREEYDRVTGDRAEAEAAVGVAKANRDLAKLNVEWCQIHAPISGRLSRRQADPGNLIQADNTALTTIVSLDPMWVYFEVDERTMLRFRRLIKEGKIQSREQGATIKVGVGLSDETGFPHEGTINYSDNKVDPNTGTLQVRAVIPNPKPRVLSPGLFTRVRVPVGNPYKALLVPEQALGTNQGQKILYVIRELKKDGKTIKVVEDRRVDVGMYHEGKRVINSGLKPGELFVVSGLQRVRPGAPVDPREIDEPPGSSTPATTKGADLGIGKQAARD